MSDERRGRERLQINLPIQVKVASGETVDLELVDISSNGLQVRGDTLSIFAQQPGANNQQIEFEVRIRARLAWVSPQDDGTFAIGLDLEQND